MENLGKKVDEMPTSQPHHVQYPKTQPSRNKSKIDTLIVAGLIIIGLLVVFDDNLMELDILPDEQILSPADIQLYQFNDLVSNNSVNVEILVTNIGEKTATDIEIYIRVCDHNGTIMYTEIVPITALLLRGNETCSGTYSIPIDGEEYLTHTVEISWDTGRNTYSKKTILA